MEEQSSSGNGGDPVARVALTFWLEVPVWQVLDADEAAANAADQGKPEALFEPFQREIEAAADPARLVLDNAIDAQFEVEVAGID